jgi:hypothetical protein
MAALYPDNHLLDLIDDELYALFDLCPPVAAQLPPPYARNRFNVRLRSCRIRLASGGKKSSVSGYPAQWLFKFEHDKLPLRKSSEADPSARLDSRASGFARGVKIFEEGTPANRFASRAYKLMSSADVQQLRYWVPCPHCGAYQMLTHDNLDWQKNASNRSEVALAERTAWYRCAKKACRVEDHHRPDMMRAGLWLAEGERVDRDGRVKGKPTVDSSTQVYGPLSKLYSLLISGWGAVAGELVAARHAYGNGDSAPLEKCYAETLAIPWDPQRRTVRSNDLVQRLASDDHPLRGVLPDWTSFMTFTADVGKIGDDMIFYWLLIAWGLHARGAVVDWGILTGRDELLREWRSMTVRLGKDDVPVWGQPSCFDSGSYSAEVVALCKPIKNCYPSKGDSGKKGIEWYYPGYVRSGLTAREIELKKKANAYDLLYISSSMTQEWRVALTEGRLPKDQPGFVSLPGDVCESWEDHEDFLSEFTADYFDGRQWHGENNEFGDALRYGRALAECYTGGGKRWGRQPPIAKALAEGMQFFARPRREAAGSGRFVQGFR